MYRIKKTENNIEIYMGTDYDIGRPETIGQFKGALEQILDDIKELDDSLKVSEVYMRETTLYFTLEEGIVQ